ncbi:LA2681 family HEPN domain-containing protein [Alkalimarinus coralli]|uniref:LA2681 family HEPN domain-containing protein n=1 Tax=Alkalimarinus coralli TaxID=2935863 RepID=UPI00202B9FEA|nr:LA2681 family HEPN domain-containing protein [Alkalimarinus coralli]
MEIESIAIELDRLSEAVGLGQFDEAMNGVDILYQQVNESAERNTQFFTIISNIASIFIDVGHMKPCADSAKKGLDILNEYKDEVIEKIGEDAYFYNLSNAKSNLISEKNPFKHTFSTIEQLVEIKTDLWKAIKSFSDTNSGKIEPIYIVNLGNSLKQQFRIAEAMECYDLVNSLNRDIPQSWINRSATLIMLNQVSNTFSIQMLEQIKNGYENVLLSKDIPPIWLDHYRNQVAFHQDKINEACKEAGIEPDLHDSEKTKSEYDELNNYRKFCLDNNLSLSEHGLYCPCVGSSRDNLTIPTAAGVVGDSVIPMEMVLNRLKSEFSFARHLYFEYLSTEKDYELLHGSCFSELFNDELLGIDVEKLRTAFRLCFGILDKIGIAICELFNLYPPNGKVYFQSFWQLDRGSRRELFNHNKSPGLLALYSIATDLNERKEGEWSFLKQLRNDLEHEFVVVHKSDNPSDIYESYEFMDSIVFIQEDDFIEYLRRILQLTRSAIFSFVFTVRDKALKEKQDGALYLPNCIFRQDYIFEDQDL